MINARIVGLTRKLRRVLRACEKTVRMSLFFGPLQPKRVLVAEEFNRPAASLAMGYGLGGTPLKTCGFFRGDPWSASKGTEE